MSTPGRLMDEPKRLQGCLPIPTLAPLEWVSLFRSARVAQPSIAGHRQRPPLGPEDGMGCLATDSSGVGSMPKKGVRGSPSGPTRRFGTMSSPQGVAAVPWGTAAAPLKRRPSRNTLKMLRNNNRATTKRPILLPRRLATRSYVGR